HRGPDWRGAKCLVTCDPSRGDPACSRVKNPAAFGARNTDGAGLRAAAVKSAATVLFVCGAVAFVFAVVAASASAAVPLTRLSSDPFTNASSQHRTEVEPDSFSFGSTIVSAFQVGRFFDGGATDIGFAVSNDGGATWQNGFLSGITKFRGGGPFDRASDPSVTFDPR